MIQEFRDHSILSHPSQQSEEKSGPDPKWAPVFGTDYLGMCVCVGGGFNKCIDIEHVVYAGSGYIKYKFAQKTNIIYSHTLLAAAG